MNQDHEPKIILTRPEPGLTKFSDQLAQEIPSADVYCEALQVIDFIPYQGDLLALVLAWERSRQSLRVHIVIRSTMVALMSRR